MKCEHIVWDWNGTLLDDVWLSVQSINKILRKYSLPEIEISYYLDIFTFPVIDYYEKLGFNFNKNPFEVVGTEFIDEYTRHQLNPRLHKDTISVLDTINSLSISQSIVSASTQKMLNKLVKHHGLNKYFEFIIGQDNHYAYGKENTVRIWIRDNNINPSSVFFIGDTLHDFEVAKNLGMRCILLSHGHTSKHRLQNTNSLMFSDMKSLMIWIIKNIN